MTYNTLVSTETLASHLNDPDWLLFDCRFDLANPDWGFTQYQASHIPGAVYVHLNEDLSGKVTPKTGRHPLPDPDTFARKCAAWGILPEKQVVVYDHAGGSFADRMWWMLRASGHDRVAILDGGFPKWLAENQPLAAGIDKSKPLAGELPVIPFDPQKLISSEDVNQLIGKPGYLLVDARALVRFSGAIEPIDPVAGHIPGAINRYYGLDINPDGTFKSAEILRAEFQSLLNEIAPENVVVYCGSGVTSCHLLVAMEVAGLKGARLYAGSWSEWCRDPARPKYP